MSAALFEQMSFFDEDYRGKDLRQQEYEDCTFVRCLFSEADLSGVVFSECRFEHCDLSMTQLDGCAFRSVVFEDCKLLGMAFQDGNTFAFSVSFLRCNLQYASFFQVKMPGTRFEACLLESVGFEKADLSKADFSDSNLRGAVFEGTQLGGADFRTALHYSVHPERNQIKMARFSRQNLEGLLLDYQLLIS